MILYPHEGHFRFLFVFIVALISESKFDAFIFYLV